MFLLKSSATIKNNFLWQNNDVKFNGFLGLYPRKVKDTEKPIQINVPSSTVYNNQKLETNQMPINY